MQQQSRWLSLYESPATITDCSKIVKVRASSIAVGFLLTLYSIYSSSYHQVRLFLKSSKLRVFTFGLFPTPHPDAPWPPSPPPPSSLTARAIFWVALLRLSRSKSSTARRLLSSGARRSTFPAASSATKYVSSGLE